MKRKKLEKYLKNQGCKFLREGARHSLWRNSELNKCSTIPRHNEIKDILAKKMQRFRCRIHKINEPTNFLNKYV